MNPYDRAPRTKRARLSVSLPAELAEWVRLESRRWGVAASTVIEVALERMRDRER